MALATRVSMPLLHALKKNSSGRQWMVIYRTLPTTTRLPFLHFYSSIFARTDGLPKRFFSESPHAFFPRILADYKPSTNLSREQLITELKTTRVSFERVDSLFSN